LVDEFAVAVTAAVVRAYSSLACLSLISGEALTLSRVSITDTLSSTLSILMSPSDVIGRIDPGDLERACALRAVAVIECHTHAPVVEAGAKTLLPAYTVSGTVVIAAAVSGDQYRKY
jgi:hypothetical protein